MVRGSLCVVVPCHNEEESLPALFNRMSPIEQALGERVKESIMHALIDDGSSDHTLDVIRDLHSQRPEVHCALFSRSFGKEAGLVAGLRMAYDLDADFVAVMDVDLQDSPELFIQMFAKLSENYEVAMAYRTSRIGEPPIRSRFANRLYEVINRISDEEMKCGPRDFRVMTRRAVRAILSLPKAHVSPEDFSLGWALRQYGNSTRTLSANAAPLAGVFSLVYYAFDGIVAVSTIPLEISSIFGLIVYLEAMLFLVFALIRALVFGDSVAGWFSFICVMLLLGGAIFFRIGIIGLYLKSLY